MLKWADVVVRKAGDKTLPELLRALGEGAPLNGIKGISYKKNGEIVHEPDREILSSEELSQLPIQEYDKRTRRAMRTSTLWTSRGCTLKCDFCSVTAFNEECYRRRSIESILRDVERVLGEETPHTFITDDNFPAAQAATIKLLETEQMAQLGKKKYGYSAQLSIHAAFNPKLMELLRKTGCVAAYVGLESIFEDSLNALGKATPAKLVREAPKIFKDYGIWIHGMMIIGTDTDTKERLDELAAWTRESLDSVQYHLAIPLPGTRFAQRMREQGRILTEDYSRYDAQLDILRPKHFTPYGLQMKSFEMYDRFYSWKRLAKITAGSPLKTAREVLTSHQLKFRLGAWIQAYRVLKSVRASEQTKQHLKFLQSVS